MSKQRDFAGYRPLRVLRLPEVERRTGRSRSAIYRDMAANRFPRPIKIGPRAIAWHESDIDKWIDWIGKCERMNQKVWL